MEKKINNKHFCLAVHKKQLQIARCDSLDTGTRESEHDKMQIFGACVQFGFLIF